MAMRSVLDSLAGVDPEIMKLVLEEDRVFNKTRGMTRLEAHIYTQEEVYQEYYADQLDGVCADPLERIEREEEEYVRIIGRNYAGRIIL